MRDVPRDVCFGSQQVTQSGSSPLVVILLYCTPAPDFSIGLCRRRCVARQMDQPRGASRFGTACAFFPAARGLPRARRFLRVRGPIRRSASRPDPRATNGKTNRAMRTISCVFMRRPSDWTRAPRREISIARPHHFDHDVMSSRQPAAPRDEQRFHREEVGKTAPAHPVPLR